MTCEHDQLMNEVTCAGASRDSRWQCVDCDDGRGNGVWFVFAPEDAVVLPADVVAQVRAFIRVAKDNAFGGGPPPKTADDNRRIYADALLALLPKP